jgi:hypothetical protein
MKWSHQLENPNFYACTETVKQLTIEMELFIYNIQAFSSQSRVETRICELFSKIKVKELSFNSVQNVL